MTFKVSAVALAAALFASPAFAQAPAGPVEGARVEVRAGLDRVKIKARFDDGASTVRGSGHENGLAFGGEIGFDKAVSPSVTLGAYAGVDFSNTDQCSEVYGDDRACLEAGRNITIGARVATALSPTVSAYAKGGYSNGRVTASYEDFEDVLADVKASDNRDGFHLGAGLEARLGRNLYGKVEYVFTDYSNFNESGPDFDLRVEPTRHQVLTGIGFRF